MFTFNIDEKKYRKVHFIGIGGISMSGIAAMLNFYGYHITGSDREESEETDRLVSQGVEIYIGQRAENIKSPDLVVYTDAILPDNEELIAAKALKDVPVVTRGVFLGALMRNFKYSIAVSGSHGKSTVTSMLSTILVEADTDASILLGGELDEISGNVRCGRSDYMLTEACEYKANILNYYPQMAIVLNIDEDHLDYYKDLNHIIDTFIGYMKNLDENAKAVINIDDPNCCAIIEHVRGEVLTFGIDHPDALYRISDISFDPEGHSRFSIQKKGEEKYEIALSILGRFNIYNAAAAFIAAKECHIEPEIIKKCLKRYKQLHRRMEVVGSYNGATVMTDYGHHPNEIQATLEALNEHKRRRLICCFQPHTYSRTKRLMTQFSHCFYSCDEVVVTEIYAAREKFDPTVHSVDLVEQLRKNGVEAKYYKTFEEAKNYIESIVQPDDLVLTTGCGNPDVLAKMIAKDGKREA